MPEPFQSPAQIKPEQIFDILTRRKWLIVIPLCVTLTLGLFFTLTAVKTYSSSTTILIQQQSVPSEYVRSVITSSINERINTISQQILSRSNLEKIIAQFGLYANEKNMYLEDKVEGVRRRINVRIERARHGADAFSISFRGNNPQRVMRIANTLASFFMDENLKVREAQAIGTSEFLEAELEKTRKKLVEREKKLSAFRAQYLGGLPDELEANLRTLDRMQEQLVSKNDQLRERRNNLTLVDGQITATKKEAAAARKAAGVPAGSAGGDGYVSETLEKLYQAQKAYDDLLTTYTAKHPDVVRAGKNLEKLKEAASKEQAALKSEDDTEVLPALPGGTDDGLSQLIMSKRQLEADIRKIQADIREIEEKMSVYQKRVEETPKRELELQSLKRDYNNIRDVYNSLLDRKLEAELSVNMEKKQKGEQFRILDHARLPEKPISPNVKKYLLFSLIAGLALGGGVIFLLEFFDSAIRRDEQIEDELGLVILASIPELKGKEDRKKGRLGIFVFVLAGLYLAGVLGFFVMLNVKGLDRTLDMIRSTAGMIG